MNGNICHNCGRPTSVSTAQWFTNPAREALSGAVAKYGCVCLVPAKEMADLAKNVEERVARWRAAEFPDGPPKPGTEHWPEWADVTRVMNALNEQKLKAERALAAEQAAADGEE